MPEVEYIHIVRCPIDVTWEFIKDMNNWATFFPGYQKHEILNDTDSVWQLSGDLGILTRIVQFQIHLTEWIDCKKVAFTLKGLNESVEGEGGFILAPYMDGASSSEVTLKLKLKAGGVMGPIVNALMKPMLRPVAEDFARKISAQLEKG
jgi:carbon monoxide dehydrogenase subunit G